MKKKSKRFLKLFSVLAGVLTLSACSGVNVVNSMPNRDNKQLIERESHIYFDYTGAYLYEDSVYTSSNLFYYCEVDVTCKVDDNGIQFKNIDVGYDLTYITFDRSLTATKSDSFNINLNSTYSITRLTMFQIEIVKSSTKAPYLNDLRLSVSLISGSKTSYTKDIGIISSGHDTTFTSVYYSICPFYEFSHDFDYLTKIYNLSNTSGSAYEEGYDEGYDDGYYYGFQAGFDEGLNSDIENNGFATLLNTILRSPITMFEGALNFEIFGINVANLLVFIMTVSLVLMIIGIMRKVS